MKDGLMYQNLPLWAFTGFVVESRVAHLLVQVSQLPSGLFRFSCQLCSADLQHVCSRKMERIRAWNSHTFSWQEAEICIFLSAAAGICQYFYSVRNFRSER